MYYPFGTWRKGYAKDTKHAWTADRFHALLRIHQARE
jgi:hypothetical protein